MQKERYCSTGQKNKSMSTEAHTKASDDTHNNIPTFSVLNEHLVLMDTNILLEVVLYQVFFITHCISSEKLCEKKLHCYRCDGHLRNFRDLLSGMCIKTINQ